MAIKNNDSKLIIKKYETADVSKYSNPSCFAKAKPSSGITSARESTEPSRKSLLLPTKTPINLGPPFLEA